MTSSATAAQEPRNEPLLIEHRNGVAILTLNRPRQRNALSEALIEALTDAVRDVSDDDAVRAVVVTGAPPAFCAGHDLKEMTAHRSDADGGRAYYQDLFARCSAMMTSIVRAPKPFIAAVEGIATAAGCQLVATCDMAVAGADARLATNGIDQGLFCSTPMVALTRNVAPKHAMELLMSGRMVGAEEAARIGLVNRVVPTGEALAAAIELAGICAGKSQVAVRTGKDAFYRQIGMDLDDAYALTAQAMAGNMMAEDAAEGIGAFIEKRKPVWRDR